MPLIAWIYLRWNFYAVLRKLRLFLQEWRFSCSRSSKVIHFGANRKHVCDFLLVRHSKFGPSYLAPFRRYSSFCVLLTPAIFHPNFVNVPVEPDPLVGVSLSRKIKLLGREIIVWKTYLNVTNGQTDGQTDRQTDGQTTYCGITEALRGKKNRTKHERDTRVGS